MARSLLVASLAATLAGSLGCSGAAAGGHGDDPGPGPREITSTSSAALSGTVTRSEVISNAMQWVDAQLQYCQSPYGQPDPDTACSPTCNRQSDSAWNPYRSDCSGFVSWSWEIAAPGLVTSEFAPFDTSVSSTINCTDLQPGDALNRDSGGHILLFEQWVTPGQQAVFLEEPGCSASMPYAHAFTSDVTCSGTDANVAYEGTTFTAIRYQNIVDDPADAGTGGTPDAGTSSGSSQDSGSGAPHDDAGAGSGSSSGGSSGGGSGSGSGSGGAGDGHDPATSAGSAPGSDPASPGSNSSGGGGPGPSSWNLPSGGGAGCDVAPGGQGGAWGWAAFAGLALVAARKRRVTR